MTWFLGGPKHSNLILNFQSPIQRQEENQLENVSFLELFSSCMYLTPGTHTIHKTILFVIHLIKNILHQYPAHSTNWDRQTVAQGSEEVITIVYLWACTNQVPQVP